MPTFAKYIFNEFNHVQTYQQTGNVYYVKSDCSIA